MLATPGGRRVDPDGGRAFRRRPGASSDGRAKRCGLQALELVLSSRCNLGCSYCYQNAHGTARLCWETLRVALDLLLESSSRQLEVVFLGGEPLLEMDLIRRAIAHVGSRHRRQQRVHFSLSTNGLLLDREAARFLARHRVKVQLSFDGNRPAQEERAPGTFERLDRLLDRLRREQPAFFRRLRVASTLTSANLPYLAESVRYFLAMGVSDLSIAPVVTHDPGWRVGGEEAMARQLVRVYRLCLDHYRRTGEVPLVLFRRGTAEAQPEAPGESLCRAGRGRALAVDVDGQAYACAVFAGSYQRFPTPFLRDRAERLCMGDIRAADFPRRLEELPEAARRTGIFHGAEARYSSYGRCRDCRFLGSCAICPAAIGHIPGNSDPHRVPDFSCAFHRMALTCRERFPVQPTALQVLTGEVRAYGHWGEAQRRLGVRVEGPFKAPAPSGSGRDRR